MKTTPTTAAAFSSIITGLMMFAFSRIPDVGTSDSMWIWGMAITISVIVPTILTSMFNSDKAITSKNTKRKTHESEDIASLND